MVPPRVHKNLCTLGTTTSQDHEDWLQPLQAFVNPIITSNWPPHRGSWTFCIKLSRFSPTKLGELTAGSDEENVIRNNPDKSEFSNLALSSVHVSVDSKTTCSVEGELASVLALLWDLLWKVLRTKRCFLVVLLLAFTWYFIRDGPRYTLSTFGLLSESLRKERHARWKDTGLREERREIRYTAGALQTFSGERKMQAYETSTSNSSHQNQDERFSVVLFSCTLEESPPISPLLLDNLRPPLQLIRVFGHFLLFLHHGIEKVERHLLRKVYKQIRRKSWSNVPPKLLACIGFRHKVVHKIGRLWKFNRSHKIEFDVSTAWTISMTFGTLAQYASGYKSCLRLFQFCLGT